MILPYYKRLKPLAFAAVFAFCLSLLFVTSMAHAQRFEGIAAVVNDDVISYGDVYDRMDVVIKSSNLPDTKQFRQRMMPQIIETLIDEQIQMQEAEKLEIVVTDEQVDQGFGQIAAQNKLDVQQFKEILQRQGLPLQSMARQIRAQMGWGQVIQKKLRSQVNVSDQDVDAEIMRMRRMAGKSEYLLAEIFLPVQDVAEDTKVRNFAERLVGQIKRGASFSSLAREFSASAAAAQGGMMGWVTEDSLDSALINVLLDMDKNGLSDPIKTIRGYHVLFLQNKRIMQFADPDDTILMIKELAIPFVKDDKARSETAARKLATGLTGCVDIELKAETWENAVFRNVNLRVGELPSAEQALYMNQDIGMVLPLDSKSPADNKIIARIVCGKELPEGQVPDREAIRQKIGTERIDVVQRGYLRELKADAYIENRIE